MPVWIDGVHPANISVVVNPPATVTVSNGTDTALLTSIVNAAVSAHVNAAEPHPAYDEIMDLTTFYNNRKA